VAQLGRRGSSMGRRGGSMGRHGGSMVACHTVVLLSRVRVQRLPRRNLTANLLVGGVVAQWGGVVAQLGLHGSSMGRHGGSIGAEW
jgi:hypothetical protein